MLQSEAMGEVVDGLREVADFVILDTAPVLLVADALALAPLVDGVLFVADSETTSKAAVVHARDQLDQVGASVIGAVLNNFDPAKARAYRSYAYSSPAYRYRGYSYVPDDAARANQNGEPRPGRPAVDQPDRKGGGAER
jgi:Mrp family chromosome partitioning ATPase